MLLGIDASRAFRAQRTGVEEYAYRLLEAMAKTTPEGASVRLYVPTNFEFQISNFELPHGWQWRALRGPSRLWTHTALARELWRNPPDVFFQPAHVLPLWTKISNPESGISKVVITIHDVGFARIPWAYSRFDRWYQHAMTSRAVRNTHVSMIVPSEFTKRELMELYGVAQGRMSVIPHATIFGSPSTGSGDNNLLPERSRRLSLDPCGKPYILSIGRIEKKKNTLGMIRCFENAEFRMQSTRGRSAFGGNAELFPNSTFNIQHLRGCHYLLIGPDGYGADEVYDYLAKRPELQSRVHLMGYVSEQRKEDLLSGARALLHLSCYEGFGLPIVEARSLGIPVITNSQSSSGGSVASCQLSRSWADVARQTWAALLDSRFPPKADRPLVE